MLTIKVVGGGCANCERLAKHAARALETLQAERPELTGAVEKVTDMAKFLDYGVMNTPGLVINDKLVSSGRVPTEAQIGAWLLEAAG